MGVVWPGKKLDFSRSWAEALQQGVHLVGLSAGLAHLGDQDVAVNITVKNRVTFDTDL